MKALEGKIALVTGGSKGIGAAIATTYAAAGARVVVNYRQDEVGAADVVRLFDTTQAHFGVPDIVVNNAGQFHYGAFSDLSLLEMQQQLNVNVLGTLLVCQQAAQRFPTHGGCIINLSALDSQHSTPGSVLWATTPKAQLIR